MRLWRQRNKVHVRAYKNLDYHRNRERISEKRKVRMAADPALQQKARDRWRRWYSSVTGKAKHAAGVRRWLSKPGNLAKQRANKRAFQRTYYWKNRETIRAKALMPGPSRDRYLALARKHNRSAKYRLINTAWRKNNGAHIARHKRERLLVDPQFRLICNMRSRIRSALRGCKSIKTLELLGCSPLELRAHLESQFTEGMTWENYGRNGWSVDHIIPLSRFDLSDPEQQKIACHFSNLQPLWWIDNIRKRDRLDWVKAA